MKKSNHVSEGRARVRAALHRGDRAAANSFAQAYGLSDHHRRQLGLAPQLTVGELKRRATALQNAA